MLRTPAVRAALLAVAVALAGNIATNTVTIPDGWDFAAWMVLLVLVAVLVRGERQRWRQAQAAAFPADLDEVVDSLADVLDDIAEYLPRSARVTVGADGTTATVWGRHATSTCANRRGCTSASTGDACCGRSASSQAVW